jgi:hypothetical protein
MVDVHWEEGPFGWFITGPPTDEILPRLLHVSSIDGVRFEPKASALSPLTLENPHRVSFSDQESLRILIDAVKKTLG